MENLSQNKFNQIAEMRGLSRDELEQIAKIRRIKNYEDMKKDDLIISLLKSKQRIAELFNNNLYDNETSDIRRILNRLRNILPKKDIYIYINIYIYIYIHIYILPKKGN